MLSPNEFTVGKLETAKPFSMILPIDNTTEPMLVGKFNDVPVGVILSGQFQSQFIECEGNQNWGGIIIPAVRIEIDVQSFVDTYKSDPPLLSVVRVGPKVTILAKKSGTFGIRSEVCLQEGLNSAGDSQAAFTNWRIVLGDDQNKRILWSSS